MKSNKNVINDDKATPDMVVSHFLRLLLFVDFFFWLFFWLVVDLMEPALTGLIVSSFSAAAPDFLDFDFLLALPDFLDVSLPLAFVLWMDVELASPSPDPAICEELAWRIWAAKRSRSMNSDL